MRPHPLPALARALLPLLVSLLPVAAPAQVRFAGHDGRHLDTDKWGKPLELNGIAAGDLDGDGDPDLLLASNSGYCRVCFNDDGGSFRRHLEFATSSSGVRRVTLGDVDGDGDLDALLGGGRTAYQGTGSPIELYRNDGHGTFTASPMPAIVTNSSMVALADVDGDGDLDALAVGQDFGAPVVRCLQNDGTGTFVDVTASAVPVQPPAIAFHGAVVDLDGDGDLDVVVDQAFGPLQWLRNDGAGHLAAVAGWWTATPAYDLLTTADFDGDGSVDLLLVDGLYRNDGAGAFTRTGSLPKMLTGWTPDSTSVVVADFDGDGRLDLAGTGFSTQPFVWRDAGGFAFTDISATWLEPHVVARTIDYCYGCSVVADVDGDGDPDLITGGVEGRSGSSTTVGVPPRILVNGGGTSFVDTTRRAFPHVQEDLVDVTAGDVDGDGDVDLVTNGSELWLQDDTGSFDVSSGLPSAGWWGSARLGDVDGDGDVDLLVVPRILFGASLPARLLLNDGSGTFTDATAAHLPAAGIVQGRVALGDVDGDGDLDALIVSTDNGSAAPMLLWTNDGHGVYQDASARLPAQPVEGRAVELADFDRDGDLDAVLALGLYSPPASGALLLLDNNGSGTFTDVTSARLPSTSDWGLDVTDLDGDGDLDLALWGASLINDGRGVFARQPAPSNRVLAADFDEDGIADDVLGTGFGFTIGGQSYPWGQNTALDVASPVDVDGDGDLDLVVGCQSVTGGPFYLARLGILYNRKRDLRFSALPRLGQRSRLQVRAGNGTAASLALVAIGGARAGTPAVLAGLGTLWIDPQQMLPLALVMIPDPDTAIDVAFDVPGQPAFADLPLTFQAMFVRADQPLQGHLSAAVTHRIVR